MLNNLFFFFRKINGKCYQFSETINVYTCIYRQDVFEYFVFAENAYSVNVIY